MPEDLPPLELAEISKLKAGEDYLRAKTRQAEVEAWSIEQRRDEYLGSAEHARKYSFVGEVNVLSATKAILELEAWHREQPGVPITIELNTPGGSLSDGFALYDRIRAIVDAGTPVRTHATGSCLSMGAFLLQAGSERTMSENAWLMIHTPRTMTAGSTFELEDEAKLISRMTDRLADILVERTDLTAAKLKRNWKRQDWWLNADDAIGAGVVDRVTNE